MRTCVHFRVDQIQIGLTYKGEPEIRTRAMLEFGTMDMRPEQRLSTERFVEQGKTEEEILKYTASAFSQLADVLAREIEKEARAKQHGIEFEGKI